MRDPHTGRALTPSEWSAESDRALEIQVTLADVWPAAVLLRRPLLLRPAPEFQQAYAPGSGDAAPAVYVRRILLKDYERAHEQHPTPATARRLEVAKRLIEGGDLSAQDELVELDPALRKLMRDAGNARAVARPEPDVDVWKRLPGVLHDMLREAATTGRGRRHENERELLGLVRLLAGGASSPSSRRGLVPSASPSVPPVEEWIGRKTLAARMGAGITAEQTRGMLRALTGFWALRYGLEQAYAQEAKFRGFDIMRIAIALDNRPPDVLAGTPFDPTWQRGDTVSQEIWEQTVPRETDRFLEEARAAGSEGFYWAAKGVLEDAHMVVWEYLRARHRRRVVDRGGFALTPNQLSSLRALRLIEAYNLVTEGN